MTDPTNAPRDGRVTLISWLTAAGAVGAAAMTMAHLDLGTAFARLGPGRTIVPAAIGFATGAVAYALATIALVRRWRGAWLTATVAHALAFTTSVSPIRTWVSVVAALVSGTALALLVTPTVRTALRS